ncbi:MAG: GNAT family N-acetyltransferase [Paludibacteraceae bacterium]|nr:GNAT family N-acetyltransferase [Paludibacteraceae bacterium]
MENLIEESLLNKGCIVSNGIFSNGFKVYSFAPKSLSAEEVYQLLLLGDYSFVPNLHETINMQDFSTKLAQFANILLICKNQQCIGANFYYKNMPNKYLYVTLLFVLSDFQHRGCGHLLMATLQMVNHTDIFEKIDLEVRKDNIRAINFYFREKFVIKEDRPNKYLMSQMLK